MRGLEELQITTKWVRGQGTQTGRAQPGLHYIYTYIVGASPRKKPVLRKLIPGCRFSEPVMPRLLAAQNKGYMP